LLGGHDIARIKVGIADVPNRTRDGLERFTCDLEEAGAEMARDAVVGSGAR
jgi:hypothetical protein